MAKTDSNINLTGTTRVPILLGTSTSFSVQATNAKLGFSIKDSGNAGGIIMPNDGIVVDYDIDVWCIGAGTRTRIHIVRD